MKIYEVIFIDNRTYQTKVVAQYVKKYYAKSYCYHHGYYKDGRYWTSEGEYIIRRINF